MCTRNCCRVKALWLRRPNARILIARAKRPVHTGLISCIIFTCGGLRHKRALRRILLSTIPAIVAPPALPRCSFSRWFKNASRTTLSLRMGRLVFCWHHFNAKSTRLGAPLSLMPSALSFGAIRKILARGILPWVSR